MSNQSAIDFIKTAEGCRLEAYQDQGGVWTIGYGHTGPEVVAGLVWTQQQAEDALAVDLARHELAVHQQITFPASERQMAACISFSYNLGNTAFKGSGLLRLVNAKDWFGAAKEFIKWDHIGKAENRGLLIRRLREATLFLEGC